MRFAVLGARMRRSERISVDIPVVWTRAGRCVPCVARDLNMHGLFLFTDEIVEPGSLMHLRVALPERTIDLFATARFVGRTLSGNGIGVEIFIIDDASRSHWIAHYQALMAQEAGAFNEGPPTVRTQAVAGR